MTFAEEMAALEAGLSATRAEPGEATGITFRARRGKLAKRPRPAARENENMNDRREA